MQILNPPPEPDFRSPQFSGSRLLPSSFLLFSPPRALTLIVISFVNAFLNQFVRDVFVIFRAHRRSFLARRHKWHSPVAARLLSCRGLLRVWCRTGQFPAGTSSVQVIRLRASVAARDLARTLLDHLRRHSSYSFGSTKDFSLLWCIHSCIQKFASDAVCGFTLLCR